MEKNKAFTDVKFTSENKEDFENILKSLKLKESLGINNLTMDNVAKLYIEKDINEIDLKFLDPLKGAMLQEHENPHLALYDKEAKKFNLSIDEEKLTIKMKLQDTFMYDTKFGELNEYIKDTIKDIAKENNSELLFAHSENRFADRIGESIETYKINLYDKTGKDITPDSLKESNYLELNNNELIQSKPNFEQLSKMIDEREKIESKSITDIAKKVTEAIKKPFKLKEKTTSKNKDMER